MSRGQFTTTLTWEEGDDEIEASVRVLYSFTAGYPDTMEEPGCDAEIEIISITPADPTLRIPERFETDLDLLTECNADWIAMQEEAAEWRAQSRRDDLLMERF